MQAQNFMRVEEVALELGISKSHAYKVIHKLNAELREKGYVWRPASNARALVEYAKSRQKNLSLFITMLRCQG